MMTDTPTIATRTDDVKRGPANCSGKPARRGHPVGIRRMVGLETAAGMLGGQEKLADALGITDQLARALMGAGESLAVWWGEHPEQEAEQVALVLMNFAWNGLGGLVQGRSWTP